MLARRTIVFLLAAVPLALASCDGTIISACPFIAYNGTVTANATRVVGGTYSCEALSVNVTLPNGTLLQPSSECAGGLHNASFSPSISGNYNVTFYACSNQSSCEVTVLQWQPARRVPELQPMAVAATALLAALFLRRRSKAL